MKVYDQRNRCKKQFIRIAGTILLSGALLLTGCHKEFGDSAPQYKNEPSYAIGSTAKIPSGIEALNDDNLDGYYSATGYYRTIKRGADGSKNICYIDFATGQEIILCSQINCKHDSEACASWTPVSQGRLMPIPVGNKLVLLHGGNPRFAEILGEDARARVEIMNLDGTDRHLIYKFEATDMVPTLPRAGLARSENTLYFAIESSLAGKRTIYAVNTDTEEVKAVYVMDGEEEQIIGGVGNHLILEYTPGSYDLSKQNEDLVTKVIKLNLDTSEVTDLFEHPYKEVGTCSDGKYISLGVDHKIHMYDLKTGAEIYTKPVELADTFAWNDMQCSGIFDGSLVVTGSNTQDCDDNTESSRYFFTYRIDPETGNASELNWEYPDVTGYPTASRIVAETNDNFMVTIGEERIGTVMPTLEGKREKTGFNVQKYGLISKENFWNNSGEITPIMDAKK